jgi:DNA polymerase III delta prime subunit
MKPFPSTLIISPNLDLANQEIETICQKLGHIFNNNNPDLLTIDQETGFGIDVIRSLKKFLSKKPFCHESKIIVIQNSHNLATEAQNALLKILEEPGDNNYLIITTSKISALLPTIISRCQTIKLNSKKVNSSTEILSISGDTSKDLLLAQNFNKEDILSVLEEQLEIYQTALLKNPNQKNGKTIEKIIKSIQMINSNVDPKSALDYFFIG